MADYLTKSKTGLGAGSVNCKNQTLLSTTGVYCSRYECSLHSPQVDKATALDELYEIINGLENVHPEAAFIVVGDFNRANMKKVLPKYYQHIDFFTRGDQTLDHCYTTFRGSSLIY